MMLFIFTVCKEDATGEETVQETTQAEKIDINIAALKGATAIGMVKTMDDAENGTTANNYNFTLYGAADEITTGLIQGEIDMAAVPCNLASVLYNKTEGQIQMAAVNTLGVLYIVETGNQIQSVEDLRGKTIYSTGQGTTPEYTLNYLLASYGLTPGTDVTIEYKSEATEVAALLASSENAIAMLPQPYVAIAMTQNANLRIALDVSEEWEKVNEDSTVVTGAFVVRKEFAEENPEAVKAFMEEYQLSVGYVNENVEEASALVESFDIFKAAIAKQAIPYMNITFLSGEEMADTVTGYLKTLFDQNPASVGGAMPEDDFFYSY
jgi:NitT/TauT family transport system substrate-binding protein